MYLDSTVVWKHHGSCYSRSGHRVSKRVNIEGREKVEEGRERGREGERE